MKNLIFVSAILFGSILCACSGRSITTVEPTVDSVEVVADSLVVDSMALDTIQ